MKYQLLLFNELEKELESYELIEEKIERLSAEILLCRNSLTELKNNLQNLSITRIVFNTEDEIVTKTIDDVLKDQRLDSILTKEMFCLIGDKIFAPKKYFLEKAISLREYFNEIRDVKPKLNELVDWGKINNIKCRIVWMKGINILLKIFHALYVNGFIHQYTKEEILIHFIIEGQNQDSLSTHKIIPFHWLKSDSSYAIFINELSERQCISKRWKYKICSDHFVDKYGNRFQYLAQKKNYIESVTHKGSSEIIKNILNSCGIKKMLLFLCFLMSNFEWLSVFI